MSRRSCSRTSNGRARSSTTGEPSGRRRSEAHRGGPGQAATLGAAPPRRGQLELPDAHLVAAPAEEVHADAPAALAMAQLDGARAVREPAVTPLHQRGEGRKEVGAPRRQPVALALALPRLLVALALEEPVRHELPQPHRGHRGAEPDAVGEVVKPRGPVEGLAEYQKRRAGADDAERLLDRAVLRLPTAARVQGSPQLKDRWHATILAASVRQKSALYNLTMV